MQFLESHVQTFTLVILVLTALVVAWQAVEAGKQAKASVKMAQTSLEQTGLMQMQVHSSVRPVVTVTGGVYGPHIATLSLKNLGTGSALGIVGIYRSGYRHRLGSLSAGESIDFQFDNSLSHYPKRVGPPFTEPGTLTAQNGDVCLRLEYQSVSSANCWTAIDFKLGGTVGEEIDGIELKHGMDSPSVTTAL